MQLNEMSVWEIDSQNLIGTDYYTDSTYTFPGTDLYVMQKEEQSVMESSTKIKEMLNINN